jgi:hypothetical protein
LTRKHLKINNKIFPKNKGKVSKELGYTIFIPYGVEGAGPQPGALTPRKLNKK